MLIAVDGGASRCRAAAFDEQGQRLASVQIESHASLALGVEAAAATVDQVVREVSRRLDRPCGWTAGRLAFGLAGSLGEDRRDAFLAKFSGRGQVDLITDGQAQLLGATGGEPGTCLAIGTGSVVHWQSADGTLGMAGGWGFPVGDEGSAAWLGVALMQAYVVARDRGAVKGSLFEALESLTGTGIGDVQRWTTCGVSGVFGRLAPLVSEAAAADDPLATELLQRGVDHCCALFDAAPQTLPRYLAGGLAVVYRPLLEARGIGLRAVQGDALDGLYRFSLQNRHATQ